MSFLLVSVIVSILIIIIVVYYGWTLITEPVLREDRELLKFSSDIRFDPFPTTININNKYRCAGDDLRKCDTTNPLSCIGCQSLIASCRHFERDTEYIPISGIPTTIPANESANEGYCLTIDDVESRCNLFHGDLALVQLFPERSETLLICNCRNPGIIGNTTILGACDTPFICNGLINNINQDISEVNCICNDNATNVRLNDIPACRLKTIDDASSDGSLNQLVIRPPLRDILPLDHFNSRISQTLKLSHLTNPGLFCPVTGIRIPNVAFGMINENSRFSTINFDAQFKSDDNEYFGIPVRRSATERILIGDTGPDAVLGVFWEEMTIYTRLETFVQRFVFVFSSKNNKEFYRVMNLDENFRYAIKTDDLLLGIHIPIPPMGTINFPAAWCYSAFPSYRCEWTQEGETADSQTPWTSPVTPISNDSNLIARRHSTLPPLGLLWGTGPWRQHTRLNRLLEAREITIEGTELLYVTNNIDYTLRGDNLDGARRVQMMGYTFRRSSNNRQDPWELKTQTNGNADDWEQLQFRLIEGN
jgi:hypothetical protein